MSEIMTAEEIWLKNWKESVSLMDFYDYKQLAKKAMIEFAKMHVEAQAKAIVEKVEIDGFCQSGDNHCIVVEKSILNAYPLDNII